MQIAGPSSGEDVLFIDVDPSATLATLKERIEFQSAVPPAKQVIQYSGQILQDDTKTLEQCSISPDSMLLVIVRDPQQQQRQGQPGSSTTNASQHDQGQARQVGPSEMSPEMLRQSYLSSPRDLANLRHQAPSMADAINDPNLWAERVAEMYQQRKELAEQNERDMALLEADQFDVDAQKRIEELIRLKRVEENFEQTREYHPEGMVAKTPSPYRDC